MSRSGIVFLAIVSTIAGLVLVYVADVPLPVVVSLGFGALCLLWLIVLLTVPWNLYFQAHALIHEIRVSRERGMEVSPERETEALRIAGRMRRAAVAAHLLSAALLAVVAYFSGETVGYYFAVFYLVATLFRPTGAWFSHLRDRMTTMLAEVRYPREDVVTLVERVTALEGRAEESEARAAELAGRLDALAVETRAGFHAATARADDLDRRLDAMGRTFEGSLSRLTDNQEVLSGIKAFLRLIRSETA
ncbi:hypothetical protein [Microbispora bryophytorum]|uniref:hypothetical protein n=1 Tax=Microbispora bryophytorum TaxID=1460882 RepID=UPI00142FB3C4|nr:hypothetical protein [Microbispora bryophytorum]MBD3140726.1 hypothetical protein [Microbispora bryophytorum]